MANLNDISDLFDFDRYFEGYDQFNSIESSTPAPHPPLPPSPPLSPASSSTLSDSTNYSSLLTEEEDAHYDNVIYHGVDSPVLPSSPPTHMTEVLMTLVPAPTPFAPSPSVTNVPIPSTTPVTLSARTSFFASASPPALKRRRSIESIEAQAGSSTLSPRPVKQPRLSVPAKQPRLSVPAKQPRLSVPGESAFQLDLQVPAFTSSTPSGPPMGRTRQRVDYSACKCRNRTSKPARHWKTACPYNINRDSNRVPCELCGMTFTRHDNMDRHMEDYH